MVMSLPLLFLHEEMGQKEREREGMHLGVALITTLEITLYFVVDPQELLILHN